MRALIAVVVVGLAILGALLHPLALFLSVMPFDSAGIQAFLASAKTLIADVLGWGLVALLLLMLILVVHGRLKPRKSGEDIHLPSFRPRGIAVGIIAYNEAAAIGDLVRGFRNEDGVVEVVVIDNNSSDGTGAIATAAGARVVKESKQGYGFACIRALQECVLVSEADVVVLTEGDATFVPRDLAKFRAYIGEADLVVGTRVISPLVEDGSQMDYFFTWGNMAVGTLMRLRFWHPQFLGTASLSDVGCTYRAIRTGALTQILPDLVVGGNHFSPHMLLVALYRGLSLIEIPVTLKRRVGVSKGAGRSFWPGFQVGLTMIWHILTYSPKRKAAPTPLAHQVR
jgi:glycosyltransferase involved in cell wall biosynthesis